jgi:hypothetical protein
MDTQSMNAPNIGFEVRSKRQISAVKETFGRRSEADIE